MAESRKRRWKQRIEESEHGLFWMGLLSLLESTVLPIPLEVVLIPYLVARREHVWRISAVVLLGCLVGASIGYGVGALAMEAFGQRLVEAMGWSEGLEDFQDTLASNGFWAIVGVGVSPVPFQAAMLGAGAAGYSFPLFLLAATLARGIRYFGLGLLVRVFGERAERLWDEHSTAVGVVVGLVVVAALVWALAG